MISSLRVCDESGVSLCLANCNFVIHRTCNNVTFARCMLFILKVLLILAKHKPYLLHTNLTVDGAADL
jgi:hypothetical protein